MARRGDPQRSNAVGRAVGFTAKDGQAPGLFDDQRAELGPLGDLRSSFEQRSGIFTGLERAEHSLNSTATLLVPEEDAALALELAKEALANGAVVAGGASLIEDIKNGNVSLTSFQRTLASPEMMPQLSSIARLLGPRGLMPNPKLNTIQPQDQLLETLEQQQSGISNYRTDKEGIVRIGIGRGSFGVDKLMDNMRELMNEIQSIKPESFGKGKKGKGGSAKGTKYYLKAHLSTTQSKGSVLVDLRTIDPTSSFFMSDPQ